MGRIITDVVVTNLLDRSRIKSFSALVDTGAQYLVLPLSYKADFGPFDFDVPIQTGFADGRTGTASLCGPVYIGIAGFRPVPGSVAFLEGADEALLGHLPLQEASIVVDMVGHRLVPLSKVDFKASHLDRHSL